MNQKGQLTITEELRKRLNISPGSKMPAIFDQDQLIIKKRKDKTL